MSDKSVEIVIGAKDQASAILRNVAAETKRVGGSVRSMANTTQSATGMMRGAFTALKASAGPLLAAFAAFKVAHGTVSLLTGSADAIREENEAIRGLTNAIKSSGDSTGPTITQHQEFASAIQKTFNIADDAALSLMKQASMLGVNNDQLQEVTRAAIGLSEATGIDLDSAIQKVNGAMHGNFTGLSKMLPGIRDAATAEEKLAVVMQASERGLAQKAEKSKSAATAGERLALAWGDFQETIGQALEPIRHLVAGGLEVLVSSITTAVIPAIQSLMPSADTIKGVMEKMRFGIVSAVTLIEVVVGNLPSIWKMMVASATLQIITLVENVRHAFTVVIPEYAAWFGRNFTTMISDIFNLAVTVVSNRIRDIGDVILRLWDFVRSGFEGGAESLFSDLGEIAMRNVFEGFEAQTESLPKILARQLTDGEKELMGTISGVTNNLAAEYSTKMAERMGSVGKDAGESLVAGINLHTQQAAKDTEALVKKTTGGAGGNSLQAFQSRLLSGSSGGNPMLEESKKQTRQLADIAKNTEQKSPVRSDGVRMIEVGLA